MINGDTKVFGVLADPIKHVKAPEYLNKLWLNNKTNQIMVPIHVSLFNLDKTINNLKLIPNFYGFCVTIPHKEMIYELCDHLLPSAKKTKAVNVAYFNKKRELIGANFDGQGFVEGLKQNNHNIKNKNIFIIGAGGASRGIVFSLIENNCKSITISNRTKSKAFDLKNEIKNWHSNFDIKVSEIPENPDIIINSTSMGLSKNDKLPINEKFLNKNVLVVEIIMEPEITNLLKICINKGVSFHKGKHMFLNQIKIIDNFLTKRNFVI